MRRLQNIFIWQNLIILLFCLYIVYNLYSSLASYGNLYDESRTPLTTDYTQSPLPPQYKLQSERERRAAADESGVNNKADEIEERPENAVASEDNAVVKDKTQWLHGRVEKSTFARLIQAIQLLAYQLNRTNTVMEMKEKRQAPTVKHELAKPVESIKQPMLRSARNHITHLKTKKKCKHAYNLVILISVDLPRAGRRRNIRRSWGTNTYCEENYASCPYNYTIRFMVGNNGNKEHMEEAIWEQETYGDLIFGDFVEHFHNLSMKIEMGFEWADKYCSGYRYLMKTDDDVFINIPQLYRALAALPKKEVYAGNVHWYSPAIRQEGNKYFVPMRAFDRAIYPR